VLPICGAIFEAARPDEELTRLETKAAAPDFWKDQAEAQKILQRPHRAGAAFGALAGRSRSGW